MRTKPFRFGCKWLLAFALAPVGCAETGGNAARQAEAPPDAFGLHVRLAEVDFELPGGGYPLRLSRVYAGEAPAREGWAGPGWVLGTLDLRLRRDAAPEGPLHLLRPDGGEDVFHWHAPEGYWLPADRRQAGTVWVEQIRDHFVRQDTRSGTRWYFDEAGWLVGTENVFGDMLLIHREEDGFPLYLARYHAGVLQGRFQFTRDTRIPRRIGSAQVIAGSGGPTDGVTELRYRYDEAGRLEGVLPPGSAGDAVPHTRYRYQADHRLHEIHEGDVLSRRLQYGPDGTLIEVLGPAQTLHQLSRALPGEGRPTGTRVLDADGAESHFLGRVDEAGQAERYVRRPGHPTLLVQADRERLRLAEDNRQLSLYFDEGGRVGAVRDALARPRFVERDLSLGAALSESTPAGVLQREFDVFGRLHRTHFPDGGTLVLDWDAHGRLQRLLPPDEPALELLYGENGLPRQVSRAEQVAHLEYDAWGHLRRLNRTFDFHHDPHGRLLALRGPEGTLRRMEWDPAGRLVSETLGTLAPSRIRYAPEGWVAAVHAHGGDPVRYEHSPAGRLQAVRYPDGSALRYQYQNGELEETLQRDGTRVRERQAPDGARIREYFADAEARLPVLVEEIGSYPDGSPERALLRDGGGRLLAETHRALDPRGNRIGEFQNDASLGWAHDGFGRRTGFRFPGGTELTYHYFPPEHPHAGKLASLEASTFIVEFDYDIHNRRTTTRFPLSNVEIRRRFDDTGEPAALDLRVEGRPRLYQWLRRDSRGLVVEWHLADHAVEEAPTHEGIGFAHDLAGQLLRAFPIAGDPAAPSLRPERFRYDAAGNRHPDTEGASPHRYEAGNRLRAVGDALYADDAAGRRIADPSGRHYQYSPRGELLRVTLPDGRETRYAYDAFRRMGRIWHADGSHTRRYYDDWTLAAESVWPANTDPERDPPSIRREFIHGPEADQPLAFLQNGEIFLYVHDALGRVVALLDATGREVTRIRHSAFGVPILEGRDLGQPFLWKGALYDRDTGLHHLRMRVYDPVHARFLQPDPLEFAGGYNWYAFAGNQPLGAHDPLGLFPDAGGFLDHLAGLGQYARNSLNLLPPGLDDLRPRVAGTLRELGGVTQNVGSLALVAAPFSLPGAPALGAAGSILVAAGAAMNLTADAVDPSAALLSERNALSLLTDLAPPLRFAARVPGLARTVLGAADIGVDAWNIQTQLEDGNLGGALVTATVATALRASDNQLAANRASILRQVQSGDMATLEAAEALRREVLSRERRDEVLRGAGALAALLQPPPSPPAPSDDPRDAAQAQRLAQLDQRLAEQQTQLADTLERIGQGRADIQRAEQDAVRLAREAEAARVLNLRLTERRDEEARTLQAEQERQRWQESMRDRLQSEASSLDARARAESRRLEQFNRQIISSASQLDELREQQRLRQEREAREAAERARAQARAEAQLRVAAEREREQARARAEEQRRRSESSVRDLAQWNQAWSQIQQTVESTAAARISPSQTAAATSNPWARPPVALVAPAPRPSTPSPSYPQPTFPSSNPALSSVGTVNAWQRNDSYNQTRSEGPPSRPANPGGSQRMVVSEGLRAGRPGMSSDSSPSGHGDGNECLNLLREVTQFSENLRGMSNNRQIADRMDQYIRRGRSLGCPPSTLRRWEQMRDEFLSLRTGIQAPAVVPNNPLTYTPPSRGQRTPPSTLPSRNTNPPSRSYSGNRSSQAVYEPAQNRPSPSSPSWSFNTPASSQPAELLWSDEMIQQHQNPRPSTGPSQAAFEPYQPPSRGHSHLRH